MSASLHFEKECVRLQEIDCVIDSTFLTVDFLIFYDAFVILPSTINASSSRSSSKALIKTTFRSVSWMETGSLPAIDGRVVPCLSIYLKRGAAIHVQNSKIMEFLEHIWLSHELLLLETGQQELILDSQESSCLHYYDSVVQGLTGDDLKVSGLVEILEEFSVEASLDYPLKRHSLPRLDLITLLLNLVADLQGLTPMHFLRLEVDDEYRVLFPPALSAGIGRNSISTTKRLKLLTTNTQIMTLLSRVQLLVRVFSCFVSILSISDCLSTAHRSMLLQGGPNSRLTAEGWLRLTCCNFAAIIALVLDPAAGEDGSGNDQEGEDKDSEALQQLVVEMDEKQRETLDGTCRQIQGLQQRLLFELYGILAASRAVSKGSTGSTVVIGEALSRALNNTWEQQLEGMTVSLVDRVQRFVLAAAPFCRSKEQVVQQPSSSSSSTQPLPSPSAMLEVAKELSAALVSTLSLRGLCLDSAVVRESLQRSSLLLRGALGLLNSLCPRRSHDEENDDKDEDLVSPAKKRRRRHVVLSEVSRWQAAFGPAPPQLGQNPWRLLLALRQAIEG